MRQSAEGNIPIQCLLMMLEEPKALADYPLKSIKLTVTLKFIKPKPQATVASIPAKNVAIGW